MKYRELPPWDLAVAALLSATLIILIFLSPELPFGIVVAIGLAIVFLLPGYSLTVTIFPGKSDLSAKRRLAYTTVFSMILGAIAAIILIYTPRGLNIDSLTFLLCILAIGLTITAYLRWSALPKRRRYILGSDGTPRTLKRRKVQFTPSLTLMFLGLIIIAAVSAIGFVANHDSDKQAMADLIILKPEGISSGTVIDIVAGAPEAITAKIKNQEDRLVNYTLVLAMNKSTLFSKEISLESDQSWQGQASYAVNEPGNLKKMEILLYREMNFTMPYREAYLILNVSKNITNDSKKIDSTEKKSVVLNEEGRFVVMGGSSNGNGEDKVRPMHSSSASMNPPLEGLPEAEITEKISEAQNQNGEFTKNSSDSDSEISHKIQRSVVDSQPRSIRTSPIIGIELNQLEANEKDEDVTVDDDTLRPILEVKGDRSGEPRQAGVAETKKKIELATEESLQVSDQNKGQSKSIDMDIINSKDSGQPSSQGAKSPEEKMYNTPKADVKIENFENAPADQSASRPGFESKQVYQEEVSTSTNLRPRTENANAEGATMIPASASNIKNPEAANDKSIAAEERESEMEKEIDSWIETHGSSPSDKGENSLATKNIRYVKQGSNGKAMLGRGGKSHATSEANSQNS